MKKISIFFFLLLCFGLSNAQSEKSVFYVKVLSGSPTAVEKLCVKKFGSEYHYGDSTMVFTIEASPSDKLAFIEMLKEQGLQIESAGSTNEFKVSVPDTAPRDRIYTVNSSHINTADVILVQKILGENVKGGDADKTRINDAKIPSLKIELEKLGLKVDCSKNDITLSYAEKSISVSCTSDMPKDVVDCVSESASDVRKSADGSLRVSIKSKKIDSLVEKLKSLSSLTKVEVRENGDIVVSPKTESYFRVRIFVGASKYARKILNGIKFIDGIEIKNGFVNTTVSGGAMCVEFEASSLKKNENEIKNEFYSHAKRIVSSLREADVKVSPKL